MLKPKEVAKMLGVSVVTLQRWDRNGKLIALRTPTNRRYYTEHQINQYINGYSYAELSNDGNIVIDSATCRGTFHPGINYVFTTKNVKHRDGITTIKNIPTKIICENVKRGEELRISADISKAAYRTILKAQNNQLLDCKEIDYFDLENKVFKNDTL